MLSDHDPRKWPYFVQTAAKHRLLIRYMKAWMPILHRFKRLVIVDAFAGRGRYTGDEPGSPPLLRDLAGRVASRRDIDVELFYIEKESDNAAALADELSALEAIDRVREHDPICDSFESAAPAILEVIRRSGRPSFWFIDPFGFAGLPLRLIDAILRPLRSEVLVTLMVRDINRFLDVLNHQRADSELFGLSDDELRRHIARIKASPDRERALAELYVERISALSVSNRPRYFCLVPMAAGSARQTVYYLVHVTSNVKGKREMKEAIWEVMPGRRAFLGVDDPAVTGQMELLDPDEFQVDYGRAKSLLAEQFAGKRIEYETLQNQVHARTEFDWFIDEHVRTAIELLVKDGTVRLHFRGTAARRKLKEGDEVEFPKA